MALNDIKVPRENASGTFDEITLPDATTSARGLLTSADKTKLDGLANVSYGTTAGTATQGNDSRIANIRATSINNLNGDTNGGFAGGAGGYIDLSGGDGDATNGVVGSKGGYLKMTGSTTNNAPNGAGYIDTSAIGESDGGNIITRGGGLESANGGSINTSGGTTNFTTGGSINTYGGTNSGNGGSINTTGGSGESAHGGSINTSGGSGDFQSGGSINTSNGGGSINTSNNGGFINTNGGAASGSFAGGDGGDANLAGGTALASVGVGGTAGSINLSGGNAIYDAGEEIGHAGFAAGSIDLSGRNGGGGGSITMRGALIADGNSNYTAGSINLSAGGVLNFGNSSGGNITSTGGTASGQNGGSLNMSGGSSGGGGSIDTSNNGGSINTSNGGGSINTNGETGFIDFGQFFANSTGSRIVPNENRNGQTITLPPASGTIALTSDIPANTIDSNIVNAKGDLIVGTAEDTVARLPVGATNGHVLTVDSAEAGGMKWAAASGGIGGSTGSTDNAILRADGTGGSTSQSSDINIEDASTTTQNNVAITNQHSGQTNSALVLTPKGTGAFIVGPKPDGTTTGGNARGARAINIAMTRTAANQVASGTDSVAIGNNTRASDTDTTAVGNLATASGTSSTAIGRNAIASSTNTVAVGINCAASGTQSIGLGKAATANAANAIAIGQDLTASGANSIAMGEFPTVSGVNAVGLNASASLRSQFATRPFASVYWGGQTTDATANVELNLDATATNRMTIAANTMVVADLWVAANSTGSNKAMFCRRMVAIRRDNANSTVLVGEVQTVGNDQFLNAPTWSILIDADDTNEALRVYVTGATSETVTWRVTAFYRGV